MHADDGKLKKKGNGDGILKKEMLKLSILPVQPSLIHPQYGHTDIMSEAEETDISSFCGAVIGLIHRPQLKEMLCAILLYSLMNSCL